MVEISVWKRKTREKSCFMFFKQIMCLLYVSINVTYLEIDTYISINSRENDNFLGAKYEIPSLVNTY